MSRLDVNTGETYTVDSGDTEEYSGATVDGTLDVDGTLKLIDDPDSPTGPTPGTSPIDLPLSLPNFPDMQMGVALFLMGTLGILFGASAFLKNYAAGIMAALALVALLMSGVFGIGLELFWAIVVATVVLLMAGMVVRWMR